MFLSKLLFSLGATSSFYYKVEKTYLNSNFVDILLDQIFMD